jgi:hypothetical protein
MTDPVPSLLGVDRVSPTAPDPQEEDRSERDASTGQIETTSLTGADSLSAKPDRRLWNWALAAGILAGLLTWVGGEMAWAGGRSARAPKIIAFPTAEDHARVVRGLVSNTAVSFIQQGAILGGVLGLAGGLARRKALAGLIAALAGSGLGAIAGGAAAYCLLPIYFNNVDPQSNDLTYPLLTHGGIWAAAGTAAGFAFGLGAGGKGRWVRCAVGGLLGGVFSAMIYDLIGAIVFPLDKTSQPVSPTVVTRLFAQFAVALFVAAGVAAVADEPARRSPPEP